MTRHPAVEKRFTVAWPMPREAPVRISVLRSASGVAFTDKASPWPSRSVSSGRRNTTRSCSRKGRSCQNSIDSGLMRKPDQ